MTRHPTTTNRHILRPVIAFMLALALAACSGTMTETVEHTHDCGASASCASERNLAAMIADPRDLLRPAPATARDQHRVSPQAQPSGTRTPGLRP